MTSLAQIIAGMTADGAAQQAHIPETWMQGRTVFGGLVAALGLESALRADPELPPLRSAQMMFMAPPASEARFEAEILRRGRSTGFVGLTCESAGKTCARGTFVFGAPRESEVRHDRFPLPGHLPGPEDSRLVPPRDNGPAFFHNFEVRRAAGALPVSGATEPEFHLWVRLNDRADLAPVIAMTCIADCPPPAALTAMTAPAPVATISWQLDVARIPERVEWVLLHSTSQAAGDGYSVQNMDLWSPEGYRIAGARQMVAIFG